MKLHYIFTAALGVAASQVQAQTIVDVPAAKAQYKITFASTPAEKSLVSDTRGVDLAAGRNRLRFKDVSTKLDPATVEPKIHGGQFDILEQTYRPIEGVNIENLLKRYVGKDVALLRKNEPILKGKLLSIDGVVLLDTADGVVVAPEGTWMVPRDAEGIADDSAATLEWTTDGPATHCDLEARYLTGGLSWKATYRASMNNAGDRLSLRAWVSLGNETGVDYKNCIATINDITLPQPVDLPRGETRQSSYLAANDIPVRQEKIFYGNNNQGQPDLVVRLRNSPALGLGRSLPRGSLQVWGPDTDGSLKMVANQNLPFLSVQDPFSIAMGKASGLGVVRQVMRARQLNPATRENTIQFSLTNETDQPADIVVIDPIPGDAKITESTSKTVPTNDGTYEWHVTVPAHTFANQATILKYVVEIKG